MLGGVGGKGGKGGWWVGVRVGRVGIRQWEVMCGRLFGGNSEILKSLPRDR